MRMSVPLLMLVPVFVSRHTASICMNAHIRKRYNVAMHDQLPDFAMPDERQVTLAADAFRLLADRTRIRILWALLQGETSVNCLAELVQASPSGVSQHLAKLRLAGLVHGRREGTHMYYAAGSSHVRALLDEALFHADHTDRCLDSDVPHSHETGRSANDAALR